MWGKVVIISLFQRGGFPIMNILNDDYGCYYIGFFIARLNMTLHSKQFLPLFKEDTATILHEYVHYLQDISTIRGLDSIITFYQKMQLVFAQAKDPAFQFLIPIRSIANKGYESDCCL